jgi:integrase
LTKSEAANIIPPAYFLEGDDMKAGSILCQKCKRTRRKRSCPHCGYDSVCIRISWEGKSYTYYKGKDGKSLSFKDGLALKIEINKRIQDRVFDPRDYLKEVIDERRFHNAFEKWLEEKEKEEQDNRLSPETLRCYKAYYRNYFSSFESLDVREFRLKHLQNFLNGLPNRLSSKYKKNMMNCLHAFFTWLKRWGDIREIPVFPEVRVSDSKIMRPITYEQQIEAIERIPQEHRGIFLFMRETGIRISEACALMVGDVDFANRRALIQRNWSGAKLQETTKGRNKEYIPLSELAIEVARVNAGERIGKSFLFINCETRREYRPEFLRRLWKAYSGVEATLKESMRHSTLSDWANHGASAFQIKELARHSDIRVSDNYVKNAKQGLYEVVNRKNVLELKRKGNQE